MLSGLEVVGGSHLRRVSEPLGRHMGRVPLHPVGRTGRPEVLEETGQGLVARPLHDPFQVGAEVDAKPTGKWCHERFSLCSLLRRVSQDRPQVRADRHHPDGVIRPMMLRLL